MPHGVHQVAACSRRDPSGLQYFLSKPFLPVQGAATSWENYSYSPSRSHTETERETSWKTFRVRLVVVILARIYGVDSALAASIWVDLDYKK